jgi:antitoxin component YwqK of YwqJK toxin-antitoxin module
MKSTLQIIALCLTVQVLFGQTLEQTQLTSDLTKMELHGRVKSLMGFRYRAVLDFGALKKGSLTVKEIANFNNNGNVTEQKTYNPDGRLSSKSTYKYDLKGNKTELFTYNSNGSLISKETFKYDTKGNKKEVYSFNSDGSLSSKGTYKYDYKGRMIEMNGSSKDSYKYDETGNMIEHKAYESNGNLLSKYIIKNDVKGRMIEQRNFNSITGKWKFTYKYEGIDKQGNWTKQTVLNDGMPTDIFERVIEYY